MAELKRAALGVNSGESGAILRGAGLSRLRNSLESQPLPRAQNTVHPTPYGTINRRW